MPLSLDLIALPIAEPTVSDDDYLRCALGFTTVDGDGRAVADAHGTGRFGHTAPESGSPVRGAGPAIGAFGGYILTLIVAGPREVRAVVDAAVASGAETLKRPKKALFGAYSGVFQSVDGAIWKVAAATNKEANGGEPDTRPSETSIILGVRSPKASRRFYADLGMRVDRDYGTKYIDFHPVLGGSRLCLMDRGVLARDAGATAASLEAILPSVLLEHQVSSAGEVRSILESALAAGGDIVTAARHESDGLAGAFRDPDGFVWRVRTNSHPAHAV